MGYYTIMFFDLITNLIQEKDVNALVLKNDSK